MQSGVSAERIVDKQWYLDVHGAESEGELEPCGFEVREIEQGAEECRASEKVRMMIGRAELPQPKKGMH